MDGGVKMPLKIKPCHLRAAREYVGRYHRHSIPPVGGKFAVACYDGDNLCGVAICGRPVARYLDDTKPCVEFIFTDNVKECFNVQTAHDRNVVPSTSKNRPK